MLAKVKSSNFSQICGQLDLSLVQLPSSRFDERIHATRSVTMAELARTKRQFINYAKARAIEDVNKLATMFVQYLNTTLFN